MLQTLIVAYFNQKIYKIGRALQILPVMIPGLLYHIVMDVENIDEHGGADDITICLCNQKSSVPMIACVVRMPICEVLAQP